MTDKEIALKIVEELPEDLSLSDLAQRLRSVADARAIRTKSDVQSDGLKEAKSDEG